MKLRRSAVIGLALVLYMAWTPAPAHADVPRIALRCGLVIDEHAHVYLDKYLYCPGEFGLRVDFNYDGDYTPRVTVDLQGNTLRGSGRGDGLTAFAYPDYAILTVINGRVENWETGVGGDHSTTVRNVKLVGNRTGFFCNGSCAAHGSYFRGSDSAFSIGGEAAALIAHNTFSRNRIGIGVGYLSSFHAKRNSFVKNDIGMLVTCLGFYSTEKNRFLNNRIDLLDESAC